jgi:hypothetical protein
MKEEYMPTEFLPPMKNWAANSTHRLSRLNMQRAITDVKRFVERRLEEDLNLVKVRARLTCVKHERARYLNSI